MKELYRPIELKMEDTEKGFRIVDMDSEDYIMATVLEFNPLNSDFPEEMTKEFAQYLIECYNNNYK